MRHCLLPVDPRLHQLQLDVVQVMQGLHHLHQPVLRWMVVLGEDRGLGQTCEPSVRAWRQLSILTEQGLRLQDKPVETVRGWK